MPYEMKDPQTAHGAFNRKTGFKWGDGEVTFDAKKAIQDSVAAGKTS